MVTWQHLALGVLPPLHRPLGLCCAVQAACTAACRQAHPCTPTTATPPTTPPAPDGLQLSQNLRPGTSLQSHNARLVHKAANATCPFAKLAKQTPQPASHSPAPSSQCNTSPTAPEASCHALGPPSRGRTAGRRCLQSAPPPSPPHCRRGRALAVTVWQQALSGCEAQPAGNTAALNTACLPADLKQKQHSGNQPAMLATTEGNNPR